MTKKTTPRKGAVLKTTTTVSLECVEEGSREGFFGGERFIYHDLPLSALQDFVDAVHEVIGSGAEELGSVTTAASGITYTIHETIKENIK